MWWILILTALAFIGAAWLLLKAIVDGGEDPPDGTIILYPDEDEHSPENTISDDTLKRAILQNKLQKIDEERRQDDVDLSYQREDSK